MAGHGTEDVSAAGGARPTVCLVMIVRDEAHVIEEGLARLVPVVDSWCIVDTGSTDGTPEVIERLFVAAGIPGTLHRRPWVDFGTNRTEALALARPIADYSWMMDADDLLDGVPDLGGLSADGYEVRFAGGTTYWRTVLFRNDRRWEYRGAVHEYPWCADGEATIARLEGDAQIRPRSIGGRSRDPDRFRRDAEVLLAAHAADPDDPRTVFYLAQSLRDAGEPDEALRWYEHRAAMPGWDEETFRALLERARLLERLDRPWDRVVGAYLEAWQARPTRAEPLADLARMCRLAGDLHLGHLFARRAMEVPYPDGDRLFVERDAHTWRPRDTAAICAYYIGRLEESFDLCVELLHGDDLPEEERARVRVNRDFSVPHVLATRSGYPGALVDRLAEASAAEGVAHGPVTATITTCRRIELFERTLDTFLSCCTDLDLVGRWLCIDDGSTADDLDRMTERYPFLEVIAKDRSDVGHARSMNVLREAVTSPWWLHLEDDWAFFVPDAMLTRAIAVLEADDALGQVLCNRAYAETLEDRDLVGGEVRRTPSGQRYWRQHHLEGDELSSFVAALPPGTRTNAWWPHFSLRPSVLRTEAVRSTGPFDDTSEQFELDYARRWTAHGWRTAAFDDVVCLHLGPLTTDRGPDRRPSTDELDEQPRSGRAT